MLSRLKPYSKAVGAGAGMGVGVAIGAIVIAIFNGFGVELSSTTQEAITTISIVVWGLVGTYWAPKNEESPESNQTTKGW